MFKMETLLSPLSALIYTLNRLILIESSTLYVLNISFKMYLVFKYPHKVLGFGFCNDNYLSSTLSAQTDRLRVHVLDISLKYVFYLSIRHFMFCVF